MKTQGTRLAGPSRLAKSSRPSSRLLITLSLTLLGAQATSQAQSASPQSANSQPADQQSASLSSDASLAAYRSMATALDQAVRDRAVSSANSLSDLDRASAAYSALKPNIDSTLLTEGIDRVLQSARAALGRAPVDLEAQVVQARSLMRKALHDQTLGQLGKGVTTPPAQAELLAGEFGLSGPSRSSFLAAVTARDTGAASRLLRSAAAQKVQASLNTATVPQNAAQRSASYLALARATGWFTVAQDAPDAGGLKLALFGDALTQLTGNQDAALATSLGTLKTEASVFVKASAQAVRSGTSQPVPPVTSAAVPPPVSPVDPGPVGPGTGGTNPAASSGQPAAAQPSATQQRTGLDAAYAALGRAQAAAGHADLVSARTLIGQAAQALSTSGLSTAEGFDDLNSDLSALQSRSGLRASDVQAVLAELSGVESRAASQAGSQPVSQPISALDAASAAVSRLGTPLWPLLFLLVGLASLYPMYLLNLAFGGRNNYWKAIAAGLGLLFLPVLIEGLSGTLAYLGDLTGVAVLRSLGNLSLHGGEWGLPLWLLLAAVSVGLASYGFRGLCRQFGLLGASGGSGANMTRLDMPQPALDWDEEI